MPLPLTEPRDNQVLLSHSSLPSVGNEILICSAITTVVRHRSPRTTCRIQVSCQGSSRVPINKRDLQHLAGQLSSDRVSRDRYKFIYAARVATMLVVSLTALCMRHTDNVGSTEKSMANTGQAQEGNYTPTCLHH